MVDNETTAAARGGSLLNIGLQSGQITVQRVQLFQRDAIVCGESRRTGETGVSSHPPARHDGASVC